MDALDWPSAWQRALYEEGAGLYRRDAPGRHFATSVTGIPGAARELAGAVRELALRCRAPQIVDLACGDGELAAELAGPGVPPVLAVDVRERPAALPQDVGWCRTPGGADVSGLAPGLVPGALVIAHEWLDVVPCPIWEIDDAGSPRTVLVDPAGDERLGPGPGERGGPCPPDLDWCARWWPLDGLPPGARVEVGRARDLAWEGLLAAVGDAGGGLCVAVDYGHERAHRPTYQTLRGHRRGRPTRAVPDGGRDLTADVSVDSLRQDRRLRQRELLHELGMRARPPDPAGAGLDPHGYAADLAAAGARGRLLDPRGLGGFWWVFARVPASRTPRPARAGR